MSRVRQAPRSRTFSRRRTWRPTYGWNSVHTGAYSTFYLSLAEWDIVIKMPSIKKFTDPLQKIRAAALGAQWVVSSTTHKKELEILIDAVVNTATQLHDSSAGQGSTLSVQPEGDLLIQKNLSKLRLGHLNENERKQVRSIFVKYKELFDTGTGKSSSCVLRVKPKTDDVIFTPQYRLPEPDRKFLCGEIPKLVSHGVLEPSESAFNSALLVVTKPQPESPSDKRVVADFRPLNVALRHSIYARLPSVSEILDTLLDSTVFTSLDLHSSFHLLQVHPDDRNYFCLFCAISRT